MIYEELIARAVQLGQGIGATPLTKVDREITAEDGYPHAVRAVYREQARSGRHVENLMVEYPIALADGQGTLPVEVMREYLDRSFLPQVPIASMLPFEDYNRGGRGLFSEQMTYYAVKGSKIYYQGDVPLVLTEPDTNCASGSVMITGSAAGAQVGDRFALTDPTNGLVVDGYIDTITGTSAFTVRCKTLAATSLAEVAGTIYNGQDDVVERSIDDLVTNSMTRTVTSDTAVFTEADEGKRLRAYQTDTTTIVVDAIIDSVTDAATALLRGKCLSTETACDASILYSPLLLQAVGIPALPSSLCTGLELSAEVAEDVIVKLAALIRGDIPLQQLINLADGNY